MTSKSPRVEVRISSYEGTPSPWTNQSVAWCARDTYRLKVASLQTTAFFAHVHDWFGMIPKKATLTFSNPRRQLASDAHELGEVSTFIQTYASWTKHEEMLTQVSNTRLMFNMTHGGRQNATDGLNNNSSEFPYHWTSTIMWTRW